MHIYMQTAAMDEGPPRFYHLLLQQDLLGGWTVIREWGHQGASGRVKREHHDTREDAEAVLLRLRDAQLRRGYRVVFVQGDVPPR